MARETDLILADSLVLYQVIVREVDGKWLNGSTFETFDASHWSSYALALTKTVLSATHQASYTRNFSTVAAGIFKVFVYTQAGGSPSITADGVPRAESYKIYWGGTYEVPPNVQFDTNGYVLAKANVTVVTAGTASSSSAVPIGQDLSVGAANYLVQGFQATGLDSTGWTEFYFAIKASLSDSDSEALVLVKLENPGAGDDGLVTYLGLPAADATLASITVGTITPDTVITVTIKADAMVIPPGGDYQYELGRFIGAGRKERIGTGSIAIERTVLRATAPL